jgi:hypothetical protein
VLDSLLDNDGKLAMLFSPLVNAYGPSGFVVSCNFYPEAVAPASNTAEVFYGQVPTATGSGYQSFTADAWLWLMPTVVMHESKHLTAFAQRLARGAPPEDTWLEEASAVLAEDLWSRGVYGTTWRVPATYTQTLYCDVRPDWPQCLGRPYSMFNAFAFLHDWGTHHEQRTPLGPVSYSDATFYGSGWALLRWAVDHYATTEPAFLQALVQEPALTGIANLAARTGRPADEMLQDWAAAMHLGNIPASAAQRPQTSFPSWNLGDIFAGMAQDFPGSFTSRPVTARYMDAGAFQLPVQALPGGGAALFGVTAYGDGKQLLQFYDAFGGPPPLHLRVEIVRWQ